MLAEAPVALLEGGGDANAEAVGLLLPVGQRAGQLIANGVGLLGDEGLSGGVADLAVEVFEAGRNALDDPRVAVLGEANEDLALLLGLEGVDLPTEHLQQDLDHRLLAFEVLDQAQRDGEVLVAADPGPGGLGDPGTHAEEEVVELILLLGVLHPVLVGHLKPLEHAEDRLLGAIFGQPVGRGGALLLLGVEVAQAFDVTLDLSGLATEDEVEEAHVQPSAV